jgi:transcriptional regulator with XRE-family HTH domain
VTPAPDLTPEDIRTVRRLKGWTQQEMADRLGFAHKLSISIAERGKQTLGPTARMLVAGWMDELKAAGKWEADDAASEEA